ncbi:MULTISPECIES: host specificity factor TipJ family phage tail protein [Acidobacteriaceae]|uniref:host specificity factor TipJ family phage tail protein n=1 Tax=Acidobacteriaceae TaxID=204434 RepID=UPI00131CF004|nr:MULTISPECIES: host specificity factor TipJ family phage tail protein [Acidobacteriaceae]MDW5266922.1 host specificity factor TipJ family phage tail protein [Edaphobacter sp.]
MEIVHAEFPAGLTVAEILGPAATACNVEIGGMTIPPEWWTHIRPKAGHAVMITRFPEGGNGKTILRIVAFAALAVGVILTAGSTAPIFASIGSFLHVSAAVAAGLAAAGLGLVGSLVINALIPPQTSSAITSASASTNLLSSITGTSNQVNRYGSIPCPVGYVLYYPPYAALPYTELSGDDQYLRCLFDLGYGDPDPSDMKIGDNDLANYTDVETEIGTSPSLFSQDITEATAGDALNTDGTTATRTTSVSADEGSIDLCFASGLFGLDKNGNAVTVTCKVRVEYSLTGTGIWTAIVPSSSGLTISTSAATANVDGTIHVVNGERKAIRVGVRWKFPSQDQYDVKVTRISTDWGSSDSSSEVGDLTWTVIRSIRYSVVSSTGTKKLAMRIKATDQLSGNIDQFNCIISQPVPVWHADTSTWITEFSDNPAYVFRWLLRDCPANPRRIDASRIDDDALIAWAVECDDKEFTYSNTFDQSTTLYAVLKDIAGAGRASFNISNGKYGVIRDELQSTPVQVFTPRNSWGFGGNRAFPDAVDALRVQFINEEASFQQDERIVYDDGFGDEDMVAADPTLALATNFEQMTIAGCTNANGAWRLGRYHLAVSRLRPNTYFWNADVENLVCSRGDLVQFANDVIGVGLAQGRITKTVETDPTDPTNPFLSAIVLDEQVTGVEGTAYAVRIRKQDGTTALVSATPGVWGEPTNLINLTTALEGILPGDLVLWGEAGKDSIPLVITKIEPAADFAAKITAVDAAYAVLDADSGTPPTWTSQITGQPWLDAPAPPDLLIIDSSQFLSPLDDSGNTTSVMNVTVIGPWSGTSGAWQQSRA